MALSPLVYLRLGEAPGASTAVDASGNGHDGTYHGAPTLGVPGAAGDTDTACTFDGVDDYIDIPSLTLPSSYSVAFFLNMASFADDDKIAVQFRDDWRDHTFAISPDYNSIGHEGGGAIPSGTFAAWIAGQFFNPADWQQVGVSGARPSTGAWHHVIWVDDATGGGTGRLYIDCAEIGVNSSGLGGAASHGGAAGTMYLMHGLSGIPSSTFLAGAMDEFAVFSTALTPTEIDTICSAIATPTYVGAWG